MNVAANNYIPSHVFRYVERELYDYPINRQTVDSYLENRETILTGIRQLLADGTSRPEGTISDVTYTKTMRLLVEAERAERAMFYVQAIDSVMAVLGEGERLLVQRKYFEADKKTDQAIADELNVSKATFYRVRQEVVRKFALRFGLLW